MSTPIPRTNTNWGQARDVIEARLDELERGTSGSGILNVSGTVDLDDEPGIREVYATAAATVEGVALTAGDAAVFRYLAGAWTYMVVGEHTTWQPISGGGDPGDTTNPTPGTLAVTGTGAAGSTRTLTVTGASDAGSGLHATPYRFSTNGGSTWSTYQTSNAFTTGALAAGTYSPRVMVRDASGNTATASASDFTVSAAPVDAYPTATIYDTFTAPDGTLLATYPSQANRRTVEKGGLQWGLWAVPLFQTPSAASAPNEAVINGGKIYRPAPYNNTMSAMLQVAQTKVKVEADYNVPALAGSFLSILIAGNDTAAYHARVFGTEGLKVFRDAGTQVGTTRGAFPLSGTIAVTYDPADGKITVSADGVEEFTATAVSGYTGTLVGFAAAHQSSVDNFRVTYL